MGVALGRHSNGCFSYQQGAVCKFVVAWRSLIASMHMDEKVEGDVEHPGVCQQAEIHMAAHMILAM